ncbi:MAG: VanZ family protein [Pirellulaceae bacterium]|nr:VanZ family protein [Pirellulaceae bacterium]
MPVRHRAAFVFALVAGYWGLIFVLTHLPGRALASLTFSDKAQHAAAYFGLAFILSAAVVLFRPLSWWTLAGVVAAAGAYGAFDELTQLLVPGRTADWRDWLADVAGALLGGTAFHLGWWLVGGRGREATAAPDTP